VQSVDNKLGELKMNRSILVLLAVAAVVLFFVSAKAKPPMDDYNITVATVAAVTAYESLSVQDVPNEQPTAPVTVEEDVVLVESAETVVLDERAQEAWDYLNEQRVKAGLQPLELSEELVESCKEWAKRLHKRGSMYRGWYADHATGAFRECLASSPNAVKKPKTPILQWLNSRKGHRQVVLDKNAIEGGLAYEGNFWVFRAKKK
jgi:uncharacterized protein YkwD